MKSNAELAKMARLMKRGMACPVDYIGEALNRLESLPDPTPQPESLDDQMRRVVERHECLREQLEWDALSGGDVIPWMWKYCTRKSRLDRDLCMLVIRGIVKAKCDAWEEGVASWWPGSTTDRWYWDLDALSSGIIPDARGCVFTELEAIDALLTEMGKRGEA
ncbi:MAG: hypothetical protein MJH10_12280 [Epibacterium sp.]|nr:hypothetical protein [Epibacterium sp.]NQX74326.1 hypothetical protein [Epibacterium sp.]